MKRSRVGPALIVALLIPACTVGPNYTRPSSATPPAFKEAAGWKTAAPADLLDRGPWWTLFRDPVLDALCDRIEVSNQNIAAAVAAYAQARALVRETRAGLFPAIDLNAGITKSGGGGSSGTIITSGGTGTIGSGGTGGAGGTGTSIGTSGNSTRYRATIGADWEPDIWGRLRRTVEQARGSAEASAADLAAARLSAQGELATDYLQLRSLDAEIDLVEATAKSYDRALTITSNRYVAGVAARTDVLQAQTQVANARGDLTDLVRQRGVLEHAIAVLIGQAPQGFAVVKTKWAPIVPDVPLALPSTLLERRPDIAAAERRVAAANAGIGIAVAAFYPNITLSGSVGQSASSLGNLFDGSAFLWSLGASLVQTVFDAGATRARVAEARGAWEQTVAEYRQTVLTALQDVEDQLIGGRQYAAGYELRREASAAADLTEQLTLNQYLAGQVAFTDVVVVQTTALNARRTLVTAQASRQVTAVALIQSLGGSWTTTYRTAPPT